MASELVLECVKGPLKPPHLKGIIDTYGHNDQKYQSIEFCTKLFNQNEFGYSYHIFAKSKNEIVGHFSVVPMAGHINGSPAVLGKAEAFYLKKEFRNTEFEYCSRKTYPAIAMAKALYKFSTENGLDIVHLRSRTEVLAIHRMAGCKLVPYSLLTTNYLIETPNDVIPNFKRKLLNLLQLQHIWTFKVIFWISKLLHTNNSIKPITRNDDAYPKIANLISEKTSIGLDINLTLEAWHWQIDCGRFYIISENDTSFVIFNVRSNNTIEYVCSNLNRTSTLRILIYISAIINFASKEGIRSILFDIRTFDHSTKKLRAIFSKNMFFLSRSIFRKYNFCYFTKKDFSSINETNLRYNPLFHTIF